MVRSTSCAHKWFRRRKFFDRRNPWLVSPNHATTTESSSSLMAFQCLGTTSTAQQQPSSLLFRSSVLRCDDNSRRSFWTLSFSGAGHLMPYHLGVAKTLLSVQPSPKSSVTHESSSLSSSKQNNHHGGGVPIIRSVSGSSSGAIAATVMTLLPHRLEEYTERFLSDRGHAFRNLRELLLEEVREESSKNDDGDGNDDAAAPKQTIDDSVVVEGLNDDDVPSLVLSICTTRCSDGGIELFSFGGDGRNESEKSSYAPRLAANKLRFLGGSEESASISKTTEALSQPNQSQENSPEIAHERLLKAIEASCKIPQSFHPVDLVALNYNDWLNQLIGEATPAEGTRDTYPHPEGIEIVHNGKGYVDGGIAAPFPPTIWDGDPSCTGRIVVSPIAGEYFYQDQDDSSSSTPSLPVRPRDASWVFPWIASVTLAGSGNLPGIPRVAVRATPSVQNLRALTTAMGVVSASPRYPQKSGGVLRDWYERGQEDAHEMLQNL